MNYLVGDVQGCDGALDRLLQKIGFSPSRDHLFVLGDLVNRGPGSLATLRRLRGFGDAATCLLGNHDWHLLAVAAGVRPRHRTDTLDDILDAPDREAWLEWLRHRKMAVHAHGWLMLHAGVASEWNLATTLAQAAELERGLVSEPPREFLATLFGNEPARWAEAVGTEKRLRFSLNALTRIRYVGPDGSLDFASKEAEAPPGLLPWFDVPGRQTRGVPIAFGHWAAQGLIDRPELLGLDSGCVWGRQLSAARIDGSSREIVQVDCGPSR